MRACMLACVRMSLCAYLIVFLVVPLLRGNRKSSKLSKESNGPRLLGTTATQHTLATIRIPSSQSSPVKGEGHQHRQVTGSSRPPF